MKPRKLESLELLRSYNDGSAIQARLPGTSFKNFHMMYYDLHPHQEAELNSSPLDCGLDLVTYQRIKYGKGEIVSLSWRNLADTTLIR